jgi:hypothetical protein
MRPKKGVGRGNLGAWVRLIRASTICLDFHAPTSTFPVHTVYDGRELPAQPVRYLICGIPGEQSDRRVAVL